MNIIICQENFKKGEITKIKYDPFLFNNYNNTILSMMVNYSKYRRKTLKNYFNNRYSVNNQYKFYSANILENMPICKNNNVENTIRINRKLSLYEVIEFDSEGNLSFQLSCILQKIKNNYDIITFNRIIKLLENQIIKQDKTGHLCYLFAKNNKESNKKKLENAILLKDVNGKVTYKFAKEFGWSNAIDYKIRFCVDGVLLYLFAKNVNQSNIKLIEKLLYKKSFKTFPKVYYLFARDIKGVNIKSLERKLLEVDKTGQWCYKLARDIKGVNIKSLERKLLEVDKTGQWCYKFARDIKGANIKALQSKIIQVDKTGQWCYKFGRYIYKANVIDIQKNMINKNKKYSELLNRYCKYKESLVNSEQIEFLK